jgi:hypothetical protein
MSLGLSTVRTIVRQAEDSDRTTQRRRIEIDRQKMRRWKSQKREGDALPKCVEAVVDAGHVLRKALSQHD